MAKNADLSVDGIRGENRPRLVDDLSLVADLARLEQPTAPRCHAYGKGSPASSDCTEDGVDGCHSVPIADTRLLVSAYSGWFDLSVVCVVWPQAYPRENFPGSRYAVIAAFIAGYCCCTPCCTIVGVILIPLHPRCTPLLLLLSFQYTMTAVQGVALTVVKGMARLADVNERLSVAQMTSAAHLHNWQVSILSSKSLTCPKSGGAFPRIRE